jgi:hypothetical protein
MASAAEACDDDDVVENELWEDSRLDASRLWVFRTALGLYIFVRDGDVEYTPLEPRVTALLLLPVDWIKFLLWALRPALASRFIDILSPVDVTR